MPRKPPPKQYQFKPGVSGNPEGARIRKPDPIGKALKNLTIESFRKVVEAVCTGNIDNLKAMVADPNNSALQVGVARAFLKALKNGDYGTIERIAERIIGKIPDELNVNSHVNANLNVEIKKEKVRAIIAELESEV